MTKANSGKHQYLKILSDLDHNLSFMISSTFDLYFDLVVGVHQQLIQDIENRRSLTEVIDLFLEIK